MISNLHHDWPNLNEFEQSARSRKESIINFYIQYTQEIDEPIPPQTPYKYVIILEVKNYLEGEFQNRDRNCKTKGKFVEP